MDPRRELTAQAIGHLYKRNHRNAVYLVVNMALLALNLAILLTEGLPLLRIIIHSVAALAAIVALYLCVRMIIIVRLALDMAQGTFKPRRVK